MTQSTQSTQSEAQSVAQSEAHSDAPDGTPEPERALVIVAHPDDVDFGAAATVDLWTSAGIEVSYCVITDGQAGGFDPDLDRAQLPRIRRHEQCAAALAVGVRDVHFLGYVDGELTVSRDLIGDLVLTIRRLRPQRVLIQSPERDWDRLAPSHPDHLAGGEAATQAIYPAAGNPFAFPHLGGEEGPDAWSPEELWLMEHPRDNQAVDVTGHFDAKMSALMCHESQHRDPEQLGDLMRAENAAAADAHGLPRGHFAELFAIYPVP